MQPTAPQSLVLSIFLGLQLSRAALNRAKLHSVLSTFIDAAIESYHSQQTGNCTLSCPLLGLKKRVNYFFLLPWSMAWPRLITPTHVLDLGFIEAPALEVFDVFRTASRCVLYGLGTTCILCWYVLRDLLDPKFGERLLCLFCGCFAGDLLHGLFPWLRFFNRSVAIHF